MLTKVNLTRNKIINNSILLGKYDESIDNISAHEIVNEKYAEIRKEEELSRQKKKEEKEEILRKKEAEKAKKSDPINKLSKKSSKQSSR